MRQKGVFPEKQDGQSDPGWHTCQRYTISWCLLKGSSAYSDGCWSGSASRWCSSGRRWRSPHTSICHPSAPARPAASQTWYRSRPRRPGPSLAPQTWPGQSRRRPYSSTRTPEDSPAPIWRDIRDGDPAPQRGGGPPACRRRCRSSPRTVRIPRRSIGGCLATGRCRSCSTSSRGQIYRGRGRGKGGQGRPRKPGAAAGRGDGYQDGPVRHQNRHRPESVAGNGGHDARHLPGRRPDLPLAPRAADPAQ